jgi:2-methylcitrate dehydratase
MLSTPDASARPQFDSQLQAIADYVLTASIDSELAYSTARYCLLDSLGCAMLALTIPACRQLLGPVVEGTSVPQGSRVPGTDFVLDPVQAAFNFGTMIRWLDFNDTWLAQEWGHPSDNLGGILPMMDFVAQRQHDSQWTVHDLLTAMIKAHEIQGVLALENSFNRHGLDHVLLVKVASTAVVAQLMGFDRTQTLNALSQAFVDGQSLRTYRHAPNTGSRKSWAAGDATSRAVQLVLRTARGEQGYPSALTAPRWGFEQVLLGGEPLQRDRDYGAYVMENVLFKISFPAEFHAQTAVEAAIQLHPQVKDRLDDIERIELTTQESAMRIINKTGPLDNFADRDHCLQYMVAVGLLCGQLKAEHYEDDFAADPRLDALRDKMQVAEDPRFTQEYLESDKRSIGNSVQVFFTDGSATDKISIDYPVGHRRRREEGIPLLIAKAADNLATQFSRAQCDDMLALFEDVERLSAMPILDFVGMFLKS